MSDALPVASSATPSEPAAPSQPSLESLSPSELQDWRRTGDLPAPKPSADQPAAAAAAQPAKQAGATASSTTPASEPGRPQGHQGNADTRIQQLLAERVQLRRELDAARRSSSPSPSPQPTKPADAASAPGRGGRDDPEPKLADFEADPQKYPDPYSAYIDARTDWRQRQSDARRAAEDRQRTEAQRAEASEVERVGAFSARLTGAVQQNPQFLETLSDQVRGLKTIKQAMAAGEALTPQHAVAEELIDSPVAPQLMRHWTDHPEDLAKLAACPTPRALLREFGRQEALVEKAAAQPPSGDGSRPAPPPTKTVTTAPPPPPTLGTRSAAPVDEVSAAVERGDVEAYIREQNAREMAGR